MGCPVESSDFIFEIALECPAGDRLGEITSLRTTGCLRQNLLADRIEQAGDLSVHLRKTLFGDLNLPFHLRCFERSFTSPNSGKRRCDPVVVGLGNRIELVIVTSGAVHRQTEKRLTHRPDVVFHFILPDDGSHCG